jgi:hypothetical protein
MNGKQVSEAVRAHLDGIKTFPQYELTASDTDSLNRDKAEWITKRLTSKRFRKAKVNDETLADLKKKVRQSIEQNKPIYLLLLFGGYKHFWNPSYPEIDFAEVFNLRFMYEYAAPILAAHTPGVILDYEAEDVIIPWMDNYPEADIDRYAASFKKLIELYLKSCPGNFKVNYVRSQEGQIDKDKLFNRIKELLPAKRKEFDSLTERERESPAPFPE